LLEETFSTTVHLVRGESKISLTSFVEYWISVNQVMMSVPGNFVCGHLNRQD